MRRLFLMIFVLALAASGPLSSDLLAAKKDKVLVCHAIGIISNGGLDGAEPNCVNRFGGTVPLGHQCGFVKEVSPNSLGGHCGHGDRGVYPEPGLAFPGRCSIDFQPGPNQEPLP